MWVFEWMYCTAPLATISVTNRGGDNLQNFDFAKNHLTIGSDHKINDFCFLKFFISMKFTPHQAQKTIFHKLEQFRGSWYLDTPIFFTDPHYLWYMA